MRRMPLPSPPPILCFLWLGSRDSWAVQPDARVEDLVPVLPHHKTCPKTHKSSQEVQNHLDQQVKAESPEEAGAVRCILVNESSAEGILCVQFTLAGLQEGFTGKLGDLGITVGSKGRGEHADHQAQSTQQEVGDLERKHRGGHFLAQGEPLVISDSEEPKGHSQMLTIPAEFSERPEAGNNGLNFSNIHR